MGTRAVPAELAGRGVRAAALTVATLAVRTAGSSLSTPSGARPRRGRAAPDPIDAPSAEAGRFTLKRSVATSCFETD